MFRRPVTLALLAVLVVALASACAASSAPPSHQAVGDSEARVLLIRALRAARWLGSRHDHCGEWYPAVAADLTEDLNHRTGDAYAIAFNQFGAHLPGVVYLDTVGAGRLTAHHITLYSRTSNGTVWQLDASAGRPRLFEAE